MKKWSTKTGVPYWNENREELNLVIEAYNLNRKNKLKKAELVKMIHNFIDSISMVEERNTYMKVIDEICLKIKYDHENRKNIVIHKKKEFADLVIIN